MDKLKELNREAWIDLRPSHIRECLEAYEAHRNKHPEKILGMDVVVDPTMPPDHWELRTQNPK